MKPVAIFTEESNAVVHEFLTSKMNVDMGPIELIEVLDKDQLDGLPVPGSDSGNNPEFTIEKKTLDSGKVRETKKSAFDVLVRQSKDGQQIVKALDDLKPEKGRSLTGSAKSKQKTLRNQLQGIKTLLRLTAGVHHNMEFVNGQDGLNVTLFRNKDKTASRSKYPIRVRGNADEDDEIFSVSSFAKLDMSLFADAKGDTPLEKLKACKKRDTSDKTDGLRIKDSDKFVDVMLGVANFVDDNDMFESLKHIEDVDDLRSIAVGLEAADIVSKMLADKIKALPPIKEAA